MISWGFDSKLQNWSGAQQAIISVRATLHINELRQWTKKRSTNPVPAATLLVFYIACFDAWELCGGTFLDLNCFYFSPLIRRNRCLTPAHRHDKTCSIMDYFTSTILDHLPLSPAVFFLFPIHSWTNTRVFTVTTDRKPMLKHTHHQHYWRAVPSDMETTTMTLFSNLAEKLVYAACW